eukprot:g934.t1
MTAQPVQRGALESALSDTELTKTATVESFRTVSRAALALTALGCTQSFLSSGLLFGWPALAIVLRDDGQYRELCEVSVVTCAAQQERLNTIFVVAQLSTSTGIFAHGFVLDRFGPRFDTLLGLTMALCGTVLLGASDSKTFDAFVPGIVLLCFGGGGVHISLFNFCALFPPHLRHTAASAVVGAFVASGSVWFIWAGLIGAGGADFGRRDAFAYLHGALLALCLACTARLWPDRPFAPGARLCFEDARCSLKYRVVVPPPPGQSAVTEGKGTAAQPSPTTTAVPVPVPVGQQMCSKGYILMLIFFGCHYFRFIWYMGTAVDQLEIIGDTSHAYARALPIVVALGCLAVPLVGLVLQRCGGVPGAMMFINVAAMLYNGLAMVQSLQVQPVAFAITSVFRIFLFSTMFSFVQFSFGHRAFGRLSGFMVFSSAAVALLQIPIVAFVHRSLDNDYTVFNAAFLAMCLPLFIPVLMIRGLDRPQDDIVGELASDPAPSKS